MSDLSHIADPELRAALTGLLALEREARNASIRVFEAARDIEVRLESKWRELYPSFDDLLEAFQVRDAKSYRTYLASKEALGREVVETIGIPTAREAVKILDPDRRAKYIEAAIRRTEEKSLPWSPEEAKRQRANIAGSPPRDSAYNKRKTREDELHEENVALKRENRLLKARIAELEEEVAVLKGGVAAE